LIIFLILEGVKEEDFIPELPKSDIEQGKNIQSMFFYSSIFGNDVLNV